MTSTDESWYLFEYLHMEMVSHLLADNVERVEESLAKLEYIGFRVGQRLIERNTRDRERLKDELEKLKYICKEFWTTLFGKQIDNLKTNHQGTYVLVDHNFKFICQIPAESTSRDDTKQFVAFSCGLLRGALHNVGIKTGESRKSSHKQSAKFDFSPTRTRKNSVFIAPTQFIDPPPVCVVDEDNAEERKNIADQSNRLGSYGSTLQVPATERIRRRRRSSTVQMPISAMDERSRAKLMNFIFRDAPKLLELEMPDVAPPRPRVRQFDLKKFIIIDHHVEQITRSSERDFEELVDYLTKEVMNDLQKVRAIYHYISTLKFEELPPESSLPDFTPLAIYAFIKKGAMSLYTFLFETFCRFASIPCVTISGWVKPLTFMPRDKLDSSHVHAWNAAYINGDWFLFDICFASTEIEGRHPSRPSSVQSGRLSNDYRASIATRSSTSSTSSLEEKRRFGVAEDYYFCCVPEDFIFTHFPFDKKWQLVQTDPISKKTFASLAVIRDDFFMLGLNLVEESIYRCCITSNDGIVKFTFRLPPNYELQFQMHLKCTKGKLKGEDVDHWAFFYKKSGKITFETRIKETGNYLVYVTARFRPEDNEISDFIPFVEIAVYKIVCKISISQAPKKKFSIVDKKRKISSDTLKSPDSVLPDDLVDCILGPQAPEMALLNIPLITHESGYIVNGDGELKVKITFKIPLEFKSTLMFKGEDRSRQIIQSLEESQHKELTAMFSCVFYQRGEYFLKLFAREILEEPLEWQLFAAYMIDVKNAVRRYSRLPHSDFNVFGMNPSLDRARFEPISHKTGFIETDQSHLILSFKVPDGGKNIKMRLRYQDNEKNPDKLIPADDLLLFGHDGNETMVAEMQLFNSGNYVLEIYRTTSHLEEAEEEDTSFRMRKKSTMRNPSKFNKEAAETLDVEEDPRNDLFLMTYCITYTGADATDDDIVEYEYPSQHKRWDADCMLHKPKSKIVQALQPEIFDVTIPWASEAYIEGYSSAKLDEISPGRFKYKVLIGAYSETLQLMAKPKNSDNLVKLLTFHVDLHNLDLSNIDRIGEIQRRVQNAIERAWSHTGEYEHLADELAKLEEQGVRDTDGLCEMAKELIPFFEVREELIKAVCLSDFFALEDAIRKVEENNYQKSLTLEYPRAKKQYNQMLQRRQYMNRTVDLNQNCVSELRRYNKPQRLVHEILIAALLLLGIPTSSSKKWEFIQKEMGKSGRSSILQRMKQINIFELNEKVVVETKNILDQFTEEEVTGLNASVAAFYSWTKNKIKEFEDKDKEGEDEVSPIPQKAKESIRKLVSYDIDNLQEIVASSRPASSHSFSHSRPQSSRMSLSSSRFQTPMEEEQLEDQSEPHSRPNTAGTESAPSVYAATISDSSSNVTEYQAAVNAQKRKTSELRKRSQSITSSKLVNGFSQHMPTKRQSISKSNTSLPGISTPDTAVTNTTSNDKNSVHLPSLIPPTPVIIPPSTIGTPRSSERISLASH